MAELTDEMTVRPTDWHEPVNQIIERVDTETPNLKREELKRADDRETQRALALQLIDIGCKVRRARSTQTRADRATPCRGSTPYATD